MSFFEKIFGSSSSSPTVGTEAEFFFKYVFSLAGRLVTADGVISPQEIACVEKFVEDAFRLEESLQKKVLSWLCISANGHE